MIRRLLAPLSVTALLALSPEVIGQHPRIEQARQFQSATSGTPVSILQLAGPSSLETDDFGVDDESFGIQQMLREEERLRHFRVSAEIAAYITDNVALTEFDPRSDAFLVAMIPVEYRRPLGRGFQFEADLRFSTFRYDRFRVLDFNSLDVGTGISYRTEKLGGLDLFARYNYNQLNAAEGGDTFFRNHTVLLGGQKAFVFSQAHYAYVGATGLLGFADPKEAERSELGAYAGYRLQATRSLQADLLYRYAYHLYSENGRRDHNHTLSLGLRYQFASWGSCLANGFVAWNESNRTPFDYDVASAGVGLTLSVQF